MAAKSFLSRCTFFLNSDLNKKFRNMRRRCTERYKPSKPLEIVLNVLGKFSIKWHVQLRMKQRTVGFFRACLKQLRYSARTLFCSPESLMRVAHPSKFSVRRRRENRNEAKGNLIGLSVDMAWRGELRPRRPLMKPS